MIALLTDFGITDIYVGVMKSVVQSISPGAVIVDLTHDIAPQDVRSGAFQLAGAWPYLPEGTIAVAVVDPGVGTQRRAVAAWVGGRIFIGPDNGLITGIAEAHGVREAVELNNPRFHLSQQIGSTFQGRDIFAPAAAHLHHGISFSAVGEAIDPESLERFDAQIAAVSENSFGAAASLIDHYGNVILSVSTAEFEAWRKDETRFGIDIDDVRCGEAVLAASYEEVGSRLALIANSFGQIEIALPGGNAARRLGGVSSGQVITITRLLL